MIEQSEMNRPMNNPVFMDHWQAIYRDKSEAQTSWFRAHLDESLRLIDALDLPLATPLIDVGGGRSTLAADLFARGFVDVTVLDIAESALIAMRERLGADAARVHWVVADITTVALPATHYGLWHDRAVFHFLVDEATRKRYVAQAAGSVPAGGLAIIATFAADGPERCSSLPVRRYDADALAAEFQPAFERVAAAREEHLTPWGDTQPFTYVVLRRSDYPSP
jgi:SAM-dependent methyltransferase